MRREAAEDPLATESRNAEKLTGPSGRGLIARRSGIAEVSRYMMPPQIDMPAFLSAQLKRTMIGYLIVAMVMASLVSAHVHLPESHTGPELHSHAAEIHFAHFESGHDSFDEHASDATAVDINDAASTTGIYKILDVVAIVAALLFLLAAPSRCEYRVPARITPRRSDPHYSPLQARAPPR
ncbi:MAG: hypothetical protein HY273_04500 [Gammaproteobacteria bacterium]|nr:hypothetical protein [Gammaproteobacteria bacterium]